MSKRYKKNYLLDGWPIEDTESHSVLHTDDLVVRLNEQQARIDELYAQLEQAQADRKRYGVHLAAALKGEKLASEPVDQRLDKVREMRDALQEILAAYYVIGGNPLDGVAEDARDALGIKL